jgi:hypothetical protein
VKHEDWLDRLWETIEAHRALSFRWAGREDAHDCCTFAAACIDAMVEGGGYVDALLANYDDEASAKAYIQRAGGLAAAISEHLGEPKPLSFMGRGDVALVLERGAELVGVCIGDRIVSAGEHGLIFNDRSLAIRAWGL